MSPAARHQVGVVVPTFRRPDRLRRALENLTLTASEAPAGWSLGVVVVDDDPDGSAADVAQEFVSRFALGCTYTTSASANISVARNTGLETALALHDGDRPRFDWVGSLDDDVVVRPSWFTACVTALADGHSAVTGPLLKDFTNGPAWLRHEPFDQIGILDGNDGEDIGFCATGNNWIAAEFLRVRPELRFRVDLGKTGGEDMDFFYRAVAAGLRPVFSSSAAVVEREPAGRCTLRYQVRRAYWLGLMEARINLRLGRASRFRLLARSARRAAGRGARQLPAEALPRRGLRFSVAVLAQCLGLALGCFGLTLRHR